MLAGCLTPDPEREDGANEPSVDGILRTTCNAVRSVHIRAYLFLSHEWWHLEKYVEEHLNMYAGYESRAGRSRQGRGNPARSCTSCL